MTRYSRPPLQRRNSVSTLQETARQEAGFGSTDKHKDTENPEEAPQLEEEEFILLFNTLGDVEIAAMIQRHPFESDIQAVDLSEVEQVVRLYLENYMKQLPINRQEQILQIAKRLAWD